jgi:hypothetical protein
LRILPRAPGHRACTLSACILAAFAAAGCSEEFGLGAAYDAGADVPNDLEDDDGSPADVSVRDSSGSDVAVDARLPTDGAGDAGQRPDATSMDAVSDGPRMDSPATDVRLGDGAPADNAGSDASRADAHGPEAGSGDAVSDATLADGSEDARCVPESDAAFCARLGKTCELVTATDNCGAPRNANCGTCPTGMGCVDRVCKMPVCSSFTYSSAVYQPFSLANSSDYAIATSAAGESILYAQSPAPDCATAVTYLADEVAAQTRTYTSRSIAKWLDTNKLAAQALSGDGLTLIALSTDFKTFQSARRSALQLTDFGAPSTVDFDVVNGMLAGATGNFRGGVISVDGLEFYFTIFSSGTASDGIYGAKRAATNTPFSAGVRLVGIDSSYTDVTGISSDRLALFVFKPWAGFVFTRSSTSADFSNPNAPNAPPELLGWQHKPLADCATLLATVPSSNGGCGNEDIAFQVRR